MSLGWIVFAIALQVAGVAPAQRGSIEGVVLDGRTGRPLSNVTVSIGVPPPAELFATVVPIGATSAPILTGSDGRFVFNGLNSGTQTLTARQAGYMDFRPEGRKIPGNTGVQVTLTPGQHVQNMILRMFPAAIVTGCILDPKGEPVTAATVYIFRYGYDDLGEVTTKTVFTAGTDDRGEFRFNTLPPGIYGFRVEKNLVRFGQANPFSFYAAYYPGVRDLERAERLQIEAGVETRLHDMILPSDRGGSLSIHITRDSKAGSNTQIVIWRPGEPNDTTSAGFPDPNGGLVGQLPPGPYQIEVETGQSRGYALVELGRTDLTTTVHVPNPATVVGRAGVGDPQSAGFKPINHVSVQLIDTIANNSANRPLLNSGPDGRFTNPQVKPGMFYVQSVRTPPGTYLAGVRIGNREVYGEKFAIEGGDIDLNVILGEGAASIRGVVTAANGEKVPGAVVVLLPDDRNRKALIVSKQADGNGSFEIQCAPGKYHIYAWRELDGAAYRNVEFMKRFDRLGKPVDIGQEVRLTADLGVLEDLKP